MSDSLWDELQGLTRPVTEQAVMACAIGILDQKQMMEFRDWFAINGAIVLRKLNGNNNG